VTPSTVKVKRLKRQKVPDTWLCPGAQLQGKLLKTNLVRDTFGLRLDQK